MKEEHKYLLIAVGAYLLWQKIFTGDSVFGHLFGDAPSGDKEDATLNSNHAANMPYKKSGMTFSEATAQTHALRLYNAMALPGYLSTEDDGTDEDAIYAVFSKILTPDDMKCVYHYFGNRIYRTHILGNTTYNLFRFLQEELNSSEMEKIQAKLDWI